ncbi:Bug family tripartite tricarboxylate transporter substrate binding protein [Diaphorobacter caeni]|uniref:Bug family tripartite tricarboxylate transporter substrate binding protein n=1 Tax=Diaphorobacter caeni TaxID=2784387 RepID=UPI00188F067D|nr:tripartite tricarboxylate transporter substrate-binding protein [Diaphorobacter caeni]MBF5007732.1 tripartite tricarboxylate transporter substrate binding protein [Diaphorobacter caeni]
MTGFVAPLRFMSLLASTLAICPSAAMADTFPNAPVRIVVTFPPGGGADSVARLIAQQLALRLKQPVVVDNRAGANGSIGAASVAKGAADGYTLLLTDRGALGINPSLYRSLPYDPLKDFTYVGIAAHSPYVLVQRANLAPRKMSELAAMAKSSPCQLNYASFGQGSLPQLGMEALNTRYGACITHVPYKGGGPALAAVVSGEVDLALLALGPAVPQIKSGRIVPLAVGGQKRSALLAQVATTAEQADSADLFPATWFGFAYPRQTSPAIVSRMSGEIRAVLQQPEIRKRLQEDGYEPGLADAQEMTAAVVADVTRFAGELGRLGIKPE